MSGRDEQQMLGKAKAENRLWRNKLNERDKGERQM